MVLNSKQAEKPAFLLLFVIYAIIYLTFYLESDGMLKKKILSFVVGSLLFLANSCSATNLISMGPVSLIVPADTVD